MELPFLFDVEDEEESPLKARFRFPVPFRPIMTKVKPSTAGIIVIDDDVHRRKIETMTSSIDVGRVLVVNLIFCVDCQILSQA